MQNVLTVDEEAYELIINYLPGTRSNHLKWDLVEQIFALEKAIIPSLEEKEEY